MTGRFDPSPSESAGPSAWDWVGYSVDIDLYLSQIARRKRHLRKHSALWSLYVPLTQSKGIDAKRLASELVTPTTLLLYLKRFLSSR